MKNLHSIFGAGILQCKSPPITTRLGLPSKTLSLSMFVATFGWSNFTRFKFIHHICLHQVKGEVLMKHLQCDVLAIQKGSHTVWPDWAIFESSWSQKYSKLLANYWGYFEKDNTYVKLLWLLMGQLLETFGLLFLQHLVTLITSILCYFTSSIFTRNIFCRPSLIIYFCF